MPDLTPDEMMDELARLRARVLELEEAKRQLLKAVELQPENPVYYENLGFFFLNSKSYEESKQAFHKALQVDSSYFPNYRNLGYAYLNSGESQEAMRYLELYLKHVPQAKDRDNVLRLIEGLKAKTEEAGP